MTRRRSRKTGEPSKPREIGLNLDALKLASNSDVKVEKADRHHIERASRLDVFKMMFDRNSISPNEYQAIRDLERDLHLAAGVANTQDNAGIGSGGCQERVTQRMIDASRRAQHVLEQLPLNHQWLLRALLQPETMGSILTRWRAHVETAFRVRDKEAQADVIHWTCAAVLAAYEGMNERRCA